MKRKDQNTVKKKEIFLYLYQKRTSKYVYVSGGDPISVFEIQGCINFNCIFDFSALI